MFDLNKLLIDVFDPEAGELVAVVVDEPTDKVADHDGWRARREMAEEWREALIKLGTERGFDVRPLVSFPATGANNADGSDLHKSSLSGLRTSSAGAGFPFNTALRGGAIR